jgi:CxxC motif-containing protein (DUF1111 family)
MKTTEITAIPASSRVVTHARRTVACAAACTLGVALFAGAMVESMRPGALPAGPFSNFDTSRNAFNIPFVGLTREQAESFAAGHAAFNEAWVLAPDPSGVWGLGPTFNEDRCVHCHENNGRGRASDHGEQAELGLLVRLSVPGTTDTGAPNPHPHYGDQLQNRGIPDRVPAEGRAIVLYEEREVTFEDGETVMLRKPVIRFEGLEFGTLGPETMVSVRIAQQLVGLGLLEAVAEETILAIAAQQDPAMRGKPNRVWDHELEQTVLGRFGWKASQPTLRQQTAVAFHSDIGATTFMFPEENCPDVQTACLDLPSASKCGGQGGCTGNTFRPEVNPSRLNNITLYLRTLTVPTRRNVESLDVQRGEQLFQKARCAACHVPELHIGPNPAIAAAANLLIRPYTDLLLHDMGEDLADNRPEFAASGREWRTPPLWGIGLLDTVNGHTALLHDGRARNITEAILWHGGQAEASRETFRSMPKADRDALVSFIKSL